MPPLSILALEIESVAMGFSSPESKGGPFVLFIYLINSWLSHGQSTQSWKDVFAYNPTVGSSPNETVYSIENTSVFW